MEATVQRATAPRRIQWGKVFLGGFIGSLAAGATAIDVVNNHDYGASISPAMAAVMILAALGLTAIPAVAAIRGWGSLRMVGTAVCLLTSAYCAANAYAARQSAQILAAEATSRAYVDAREAIETAKGEAEAARSEAAAITEPMPSSELQRLYDDARARRDAETDAKRGGCGPICKKAEAEMPEFLARLGQAKAREAALARAEKAETRLAEAKQAAKAGDAEPNMIASAIAARYGLDAHQVTRNIALIMSMLGIAVTLCVACYMHDAVCLIVEGIRGEAKPEPTKEPTPSAPRTMKASRPVILAGMTNDKRLDHFIKTQALPLLAEKPFSSKELHALLKEWWMERLPGIEAPKQRKLAERMKVAGFRSVKVRGIMTYGAELALVA